MSIGPKTTIKRSCADCEVCQRERYTCQGDSGTDVYCAHPNFPVRRIIGDSRWDTPQWCPAEPEIAARADARIAELERECTQWREELRIYRDTENARIAELEQAVTVRDTEIARLETDLELAHAMLDEAATDPAGQYYFGLRCGVEDRDIQDRYEAAEYGWQRAFEYVGSVAGNKARAGNGGGV